MTTATPQGPTPASPQPIAPAAIRIELTPRRLWRIVRSRHYWVWIPFVVCATLALAITRLALPTLYTASADVLLDFRETDPIQGQTQMVGLISPAYVATQADIVVSDRVARRVVQDLGLDTNAQSIQQWHEAGEPGTIDQYYMDTLRKALEVRPSRMSNVLSIKYTNPSASYAATVANAFAKAYVRTEIELKAAPARDVSVWYDERVAEIRKQLESAQGRLSEFQRVRGMVVPPDDHTVDIETARLNELSGQLAQAQGQHAESQSRRNEAQDNLGDSPDVMQNSVIAGLRSDIARAEARQEELARDLGRNHPKFISSQAEIDSLKAKLDAEIHHVATSVGGTNSVNEQKERQLRAALDQQQQRVLQLRGLRDEAAVLRNDVDSAQKAYDRVLQQMSSSSLEAQVQQTNVTVLSEALPPSKKSSPHTSLNVLLGAVIGAVLGLGLALILEWRRPLLRVEHDVPGVLQVPLLLSIPNTAARSRRLPWFHHLRWAAPSTA